MASRPPGTPILGGQGVGVGGLSGGVGSATPGGSTAGAAAGTAGPGASASIVGGIGGTAGQTAAMAAAAVAARNANLSALQEIEEAYNKRLDMDVNQLMESFGDIIKVANVSGLSRFFSLCDFFLHAVLQKYSSRHLFFFFFFGGEKINTNRSPIRIRRIQRTSTSWRRSPIRSKEGRPTL